MKYTVKPIVCDYAVIRIGTAETVCICNIKRNAELIADILNGDTDNSCAYSYDVYPNAKYKVAKSENNYNSEENNDNVLISKKVVLDMLNKIGYEYDPDYKKWVNYVEKLPTYSAFAKEDTAEWITKWDEEEREERHYCTNCNDYQLFQTKFCSNCGARMKGDTE